MREPGLIHLDQPDQQEGWTSMVSPSWRIGSFWRVGSVAVCLLAGLLMGTARSYSHGQDIRNRSVDLSVLVQGAGVRVATAETRAAGLQKNIDAVAGASGATGDMTGASGATGDVAGASGATGDVAGASGATGDMTGASGADLSPQVVSARKAAAALMAPAGLTAVRGPALRVSLSDAQRNSDGNYPEGVDPDDLVVHQQDVQSVVNALWAGGAEAMMIMDQRVVTTSAVRCIGNTLLLQGRTYSPPFVVTAIGDATRMERSLDVEPGVALFQTYVQKFDLGFEIEPLKDATLPAYTGLIRLTAAHQEKK